MRFTPVREPPLIIIFQKITSMSGILKIGDYNHLEQTQENKPISINWSDDQAVHYQMAINCLNNYILGKTTFESFPASAQEKKRLEFAQPIEKDISSREFQCYDNDSIAHFEPISPPVAVTLLSMPETAQAELSLIDSRLLHRQEAATSSAPLCDNFHVRFQTGYVTATDAFALSHSEQKATRRTTVP